MLRFSEAVIYIGPLSWQNEGSTQACLLQSQCTVVPTSHAFRETLVRGLMDKTSQVEFCFDDFNHKEELFSDQLLNI